MEYLSSKSPNIVHCFLIQLKCCCLPAAFNQCVIKPLKIWYFDHIITFCMHPCLVKGPLQRHRV